MLKRILTVSVILVLLGFILVVVVFKTYFCSGTLDRARVSPDRATSFSAVQVMLVWYQREQSEINSLPLLGIMEGMNRISVDTSSTRKYLDLLRHSRVFTDSFIIRKSVLFERVEERLAKTNQSSDPVDGMTNDFLLFPLRAEQRMDPIDLPMRIVSSGTGDSALVELEVIDHRLLIRVKKSRGSCKVDDIRWGGAIDKAAGVEQTDAIKRE
jgi:hypothetical protein